MNISPTSELLFFDSFEIAGLKSFLVKHAKKITNKFLKGIKKTHRVDQKLTFQKLKISMQDYEKLTNNNMLTETDRDFFHLLESFGKNKNIKKFVNV